MEVYFFLFFKKHETSVGHPSYEYVDGMIIRIVMDVRTFKAEGEIGNHTQSPR